MSWPFLEHRVNVWDPWRDVRQFKDEMDRVLRQYVSGPLSVPAEFPAVDVWSNDEQAYVTAEIPGVVPDKLEITVQDDQLTVRGSRCAAECAEGEVYHRRERGFGEFIRTIGLPFSVDSEKVSAEYRNGILKVRLPRAEHDKPKLISVKAE
ncbi:Hsp20/alpha crystallin family protein [bacterium]|nr:Hsp20/alpha crystallin family protein [bacterium]